MPVTDSVPDAQLPCSLTQAAKVAQLRSGAYAADGNGS
jgi:hypothetical protein